MLGLEQRHRLAHAHAVTVPDAGEAELAVDEAPGGLLLRIEPAAVEVLGSVRQLGDERRHLEAPREGVRAARAEVAARSAGSISDGGEPGIAGSRGASVRRSMRVIEPSRPHV